MIENQDLRKNVLLVCLHGMQQTFFLMSNVFLNTKFLLLSHGHYHFFIRYKTTTFIFSTSSNWKLFLNMPFHILALLQMLRLHFKYFLFLLTVEIAISKKICARNIIYIRVIGNRRMFLWYSSSIKKILDLIRIESNKNIWERVLVTYVIR